MRDPEPFDAAFFLVDLTVYLAVVGLLGGYLVTWYGTGCPAGDGRPGGQSPAYHGRYNGAT